MPDKNETVLFPLVQLVRDRVLKDIALLIIRSFIFKNFLNLMIRQLEFDQVVLTTCPS